MLSSALKSIRLEAWISWQAFGAGVFEFPLLTKLLAPVLKPIVRLIIGVFIVPLFRLILHRFVRTRDLGDELERDITKWLRGSLVLLVANSNMESLFFEWVPIDKDWWVLPLRLLLAISVIESMPDQELFLIIHTGPPPLVLEKGRRWESLKKLLWPTLRGIFNQHLIRSSAVFVILSVVLNPSPWVWLWYGLAITNYLIIGLVTSRDRAVNILAQYDKAVTDRRHEIEIAVLKHDQQEVAEKAGR